jgi:uncharacterized membrane protein
MPPSSSSGNRGSRPVKASSQSPFQDDHSRIARELEEIRLRELELTRKHEEMQRKVADLPKQIEMRERKQREMIRLQVMADATMADGFGRPRDKRHAVKRKPSSSSRRMTRPEERSAQLQFLLLCAVLAIFLVLLWKSLP